MIKIIYILALFSLSLPASSGINDIFTTTTSLNTISPTPNLEIDDNRINMSISVSEDVTLAEFSSSMNCKTGDINISASIPEITNFNDAVKAFAPFAVNDQGEVDLGNFLQDLLREMAYQEASEVSLDFIAYIHYYITGTLNEQTQPADLNLFKLDEFKKCSSSVTAKAIKEGGALGFTSGSDQDTMHFLLGLDAGAFLAYAKCYKNNRLVVGAKEAERFEKSKKIVRAIFNKFLNSQFNFNVKMPEQCTEFAKEMAKPTKPGHEEQRDERNLSQQGEGRDMSGGSTVVGVFPEKKSFLSPSSGDSEQGKPSPTSPDKETNTSSTEKSSIDPITGVSPTDEIMTQGTMVQTKFDWSTMVTFIPSQPNVIDFLDLTPLERIYLYNSTYNDFFDSIKESNSYKPLSASSKIIAKNIITRLITLQQFNPYHLQILECAINHNTCDFNWITHAHYSLFVDNNGKKYTCSNYGSSPDEPCISKLDNPHTSIKGPKNLLPVNKYLQSQYMRKKIQNLFTEYVTDYYVSTGSFVFENSFTGYPKVETTIRAKIKLLNKGDLLYKFWSSPITNISATHMAVIGNSRDTLDPSDDALYQHVKKIIYDIVTQSNTLIPGSQAVTTKISLTPFLYQPINELQLAKTLYMLEDPIKIRSMAQSHPAHTTLPSIEINPIYINPHGYKQLDNSVVKSKSDVVEPEKADAPASLDSAWNCFINCPVKDLPASDTDEDVVYGVNLPLPLLRDLLSVKLSAMKSPMSPSTHKLSTSDSLVFKFYPYNNSVLSLPSSIDTSDANNVHIILTAFRKFYVKRLLDNYTEKYRIVPDFVYKQIKKRNTTVTSIEATEYDLKRTNFKMEMRRQMLRLLTY